MSLSDQEDVAYWQEQIILFADESGIVDISPILVNVRPDSKCSVLTTKLCVLKCVNWRPTQKDGPSSRTKPALRSLFPGLRGSVTANSKLKLGGSAVAVSSAIPIVTELGALVSTDPVAWISGGPEVLEWRRHFLSLIDSTSSDIPLRQFFPRLPPNVLIPYHRSTTRIRQCFQKRAGLTTYADLLDRTVRDLYDVQNAGKGSVHGLLTLALEDSIGFLVDPTSAATEPSGLVGRPRLPELVQVEQWVSERCGGRKLGDFLALRPEASDMPHDVRQLWRQTLETPLETASAPSDPGRSAWDLLSELGDRERTAFYLRALDTPTRSLAAVGDRLSVTPGRAHQIQRAAEQRLRTLIEEPQFRSLRWYCHDLRNELGSVFPVELLSPTHQSSVFSALYANRDVAGGYGHDPVWRLMLWLAGPFVEQAGWVVRHDVDLDKVRNSLLLLASESVSLTTSEAVMALSKWGVVDRAARALAEQSDGLKQIGDEFFFWKGSVADRAALALGLLCAPCSADDLVDHIGEGQSVRGLRKRLMADPRFIRTDRHSFGLSAWGLEEYSGISEEIAERIERAGGEANLEAVVAELTADFDIAESSVRQYAGAERFLSDAGRIRLRTTEPFDAKLEDPLAAAGVFAPTSNRLRILTPVTHHTLRASGRSIRRSVAAGLGVGPGEHRQFTTGMGNTITVSWRIESAHGPGWGSMACIAAEVGASEGQGLVLDFDLEDNSVRPFLVHESVSGAARLRLLSGSAEHAEVVEGLAANLNVDCSAVRATLQDRGDSELIDHLPDVEVGESLESALLQLGELLGGLD